MVYHIPEGFTPTIVPHGNCKADTPFFPTLPSTSKAIKDKGKSHGPKEVVTSVESSVGGIVGADYPGALPRNELQVTNYKRNARHTSRMAKRSLFVT